MKELVKYAVAAAIGAAIVHYWPKIVAGARPTAKSAVKTALRVTQDLRVKGAEFAEATEDLLAEAVHEMTEEAVAAGAAAAAAANDAAAPEAAPASAPDRAPDRANG